MDPDSTSPPSQPQLSLATTAVTWPSKGSPTVCQLPNTISGDIPHRGALSGDDRNSRLARLTTGPPSPYQGRIEHQTKPPQPSPTSAFITVPYLEPGVQAPNAKKRPPEADIPGIICFPSRMVSSSTKKRKRLTAEQRDGAKRVRKRGACLRCYVQKVKCSEGRPCEQCQALFNRSYGSKMLQWTACVSSHLPDINIFAHGMSLSHDVCVPAANSGASVQKLDLGVSTFLYNFLLLDTSLISSGRIITVLDSLYTEVLQHIYGPRAHEVHPFILGHRTPLHILIQINVILLGSPVVGAKLIGYVRYLQSLRAICGVLAFDSLGKVLDRTTLATSTLDRQKVLILQFALLLDQVLEIKGKTPAAVVCSVQDKVYGDMHQHLTQYISYYLRKLISGVFGQSYPILKCFDRTERGEQLGEGFWDMLSDLIGSSSVPLRKPPKLRKYADMNWKTSGTGVRLGPLFHEMYAFKNPVPCN
ncbi:hypothetical protein K469DRAFT_698491 [Zopfia rhizophila CBS 207.26]|uniref:Zn(2)-C6 fungal-type domain-containing protein n=1 Tax=Zopfia rhizophila CBS 207.26 TaxID=1314779 RepID=A0A6A6ES05_9PEZI|nr:hypothetical protein K469DRAFT_698491 [Zopfia rhizophila CBS 207.26]